MEQQHVTELLGLKIMESQLDLGGDGGVEGQDTKKKPNTTET